MADVIKKATNRFTKGLVMDFSPENTKNEVLTHALNATLLTFNGNELSLQNDMGNARVETAFLPEGYMPVGTCEYGGIIYIVSYNPLEDKSQIGCFPSPERNVSSDELGLSEVTLDKSLFQELDGNSFPTGDIKNTSQYVLLRNDNLNPGDKFLVHATPTLYNELLADLSKSEDGENYDIVNHPIIALNLVSIEDTGRIIYLNSDLRLYDVHKNSSHFRYHILGENPEVGGMGSVDIDSYRTVLSSGYNVFKSKTSGKLAILAELITVDSYSVTHSVVPKKTNIEGVDQAVDGYYDVFIHTEIEPEVTASNYTTVPKVSYYYLKDSQGELQTSDGNIKMFSDTGYINTDFTGVNLSKVYTPTDSDNPMNLNVSMSGAGGKFYFHNAGSYHGRMEEHDGFITETPDIKTYTKFTEDNYHRVMKSQVLDNTGTNFKTYFTKDIQAKFYKYDASKEGYTEFTGTTLDVNHTYYIKTTKYDYLDAQRDDVRFKDTGKPLYKVTSEIKIADQNIILDSTIEKFQESEVHVYTEATSEELANYGNMNLFSKDGDSYVKLNGAPVAGVTYYRMEIHKPMVSIGFEPSTEEYRGDIFYYPGSLTYIEADADDLKLYWDFENLPKTDEAPWGAPIMLYYKDPVDAYRLATESEMLNFVEQHIVLYYKEDYTLITYSPGLHPDDEPMFLVVPMDAYVTTDKFQADPSLNYIQGCEKPEGNYPKDDPIVMCTVAEFVPEKYTKKDQNNNDIEVVNQYPDLKLAGVKIPGIFTANNLGLPFKYSYTLTPCMNYGKLDHLSVSNVVDFGNIHAFDKSNFTEWRYHLDGNQLRLTFGAEVFDTHEDVKVDAIILEFYDMWGFAGSVEISNKKSYSGTFTKLIAMNSVGGLSKNRIHNGVSTSNFKRNVNIKPVVDEDTGNIVFKYGDIDVTYSEEAGWARIPDENNDCGVMYSNLIYGVKTYLRRTYEDKVEYIPKKNMVLFTLPLYNDFYYSVKDFNTLENPKLHLSLSYKLTDSGTAEPYSVEGLIQSGYNAVDKTSLAAYTAGTLTDSSLDITKYYRYKGTTSLYVELGLHKMYNDIGLMYDPELNDLYKCHLYLLSNHDSAKTYSVTSDLYSDSSESSLLNYGTVVQENPNKLTMTNFDGNLMDKGFMNKIGYNPIEIKYDFVAGYQIQVSDINLKTIATPVITALLREENGQFNYRDFNLVLNSDGKVYPSMLYTGGKHDVLELGLVDLTPTPDSNGGMQPFTNFNMWGQLSNRNCVYLDGEIPIGQEHTQKSLYSGDPMKSLYNTLGQYTFFQPHAHSVETDYHTAVNIHKMSPSLDIFYVNSSADHGNWIIMEKGGKGQDDETDNARGRTPSWNLRDNPRYNMAAYTIEQYNSNYGVISTNYYSVVEADSLGSEYESMTSEENAYGYSSYKIIKHRRFHGATADELVDMYSKFIKTMSQVYAFNPDYTSINTFQGNAAVNDKEVYIASNIINDKSEFTINGKTGSDLCINDYIYLNGINITRYLLWLDEYSGGSTFSDNNSIKFLPDFTYCGTATDPLLLTSLTYRMIPDNEILKEVEPNIGGSYAIKHSDGSVDWINGTIRHDTLYGYSSTYHKLIPLQVGNYEIDQNTGNINVDKIHLEAGIHEVMRLSNSGKALSSEGYVSDDYNVKATGTNVMVLGSYNDYVFFTNVDTSTNAIIDLEVTNADDDSIMSEVINFQAEYSSAHLNSSCGITDSYSINVAKLTPASLYKIVTSAPGSNISIQYNGDIVPVQIKIDSFRTGYAWNKSHGTSNDYWGTNHEEKDLTIMANAQRIYAVKFKNVKFVAGNMKSVKSVVGDVMSNRATYSYYTKENNNRYEINSSYSYSVIPFTSITLEDLYYEPTNPVHKLFFKSDRFWYPVQPNSYDGRVFYRALPAVSALTNKYSGNLHLESLENVTRAQANEYVYSYYSGGPGTWQHNNMLYLHSGPCFMPPSTRDNYIKYE